MRVRCFRAMRDRFTNGVGRDQRPRFGLISLPDLRPSVAFSHRESACQPMKKPAARMAARTGTCWASSVVRLASPPRRLLSAKAKKQAGDGAGQDPGQQHQPAQQDFVLDQHFVERVQAILLPRSARGLLPE